MADKCEHCGIEAKEHTIPWLTTRPDDLGRPVEDGPEWGVYRLWDFGPGMESKWQEVTHETLIGVVCRGCWDKGLRFKEGFKG